MLGCPTMDDTAARVRSARQTCPFLTTKETAFYLRLAPGTLKRLRAADIGPACRMHGQTWYYHIDDIEAWSNARRRGGKRG